MTSLLIDGFDGAIKESLDDPRLPKLIESLWYRSIKNIVPDGTPYEGADRAHFSSEGTRVAACATIMEKFHPATRATELAAKVLRRYTQLQQMTHYRIPSAIFEVSVSSWLLAYWRLGEKKAVRIRWGGQRTIAMEEAESRDLFFRRHHWRSLNW